MTLPLDNGHWREVWPSFESALRKKLNAGFREYGDDSFDRDPIDLVAELKAEAIDIAGWGLVVFSVIERFEARVMELEREIARLQRVVRDGQRLVGDG